MGAYTEYPGNQLDKIEDVIKTIRALLPAYDAPLNGIYALDSIEKDLRCVLKDIAIELAEYGE